MFLVYYFLMLVSFFFFKQKTAYEMRISDWSSDVCSSDLISARHCRGAGRHQPGAKADPRAGLDRCRIAVGKGDADPEAGMLALIDQRDPRHASPDKPLDTFHLAGDGCGNRPIEPGRGHPLRPHPDQGKADGGDEAEPQGEPSHPAAKSRPTRSAEHTSELQSLTRISSTVY